MMVQPSVFANPAIEQLLGVLSSPDKAKEAISELRRAAADHEKALKEALDAQGKASEERSRLEGFVASAAEVVKNVDTAKVELARLAREKRDLLERAERDLEDRKLRAYNELDELRKGWEAEKAKIAEERGKLHEEIDRLYREKEAALAASAAAAAKVREARQALGVA